MRNKAINVVDTQTVILLIFFILYVVFQTITFAQIQSTEKKYVRIGQLQSKFSAYGSERAWNNQYYEGMEWPADYPEQDNAVIERVWLACEDFTDMSGESWENYGVYFAAGYVADYNQAPGTSLYPVELKQTAKFAPVTIYVDGKDISAPYAGDVDEIDPEIIADRIVTNIVHTTMGLTMTRKVLAFSQQYHDNYFIKEYTFTNTGNTDYDDDIEINAPLKGVYFSWGTRYAVCREGAYKFDNTQSWGQHTWVSKRGEDYAQHAAETIDESNPIVEWLRCGFSWAGQSDNSDWDNIGAPNRSGNGRLCSPQHAGTVVIHVDKSASDATDDPNQPVVLGWHAGDTYPSLGNMIELFPMTQLYRMVQGNPHDGLGNPSERQYETNCDGITSRVDPFKLHNDAGGTNIWISYGPFDLEHNESITIVEAEAVAGLNRIMCEQIGARWKAAYDDPSDTGPFPLPRGSIAGYLYQGANTNDKDVYKNAWVYTGWDSIMQTFGRAKRNFDAGYEIPQPPLPPPVVEVTSGGDRISLSWVPSSSEGEPDFGGYRIFRAVGKPDTVYQEIFACGNGTDNPTVVNSYDDTSPVRGFSYYYYIVDFNDGSNNTSGATNPIGELHSGRFYTQTTEPAFLRRKAGMSLDDIRVVPNPYNVKGRDYNYPKEQDKIGFLNIPAFCTIKIYTERGDLINTIEHTDGSGDEYWNSLTTSRQVVVSGVYIAYFEVTNDYVDSETGQLLYKKGDNTYRKFVIIR